MKIRTKSLTIFTLLLAFVAMISFATINLTVKKAVAEEDSLPNATATVEVTVESLPDASGKIVYNVAPMLTAGDKSVKISEFNAPVTFRLPVLSNETKTVANVYHNDDRMGTYDIKEESGSKFVEVSSKSFSTYAVEPIDAFVAKIGDKGFSTIAEAVEYAKTNSITDLEITIIGENTKDEAIALKDSFYLYTENVFDSVTIKQDNGNKPFYIDVICTGSRTNGGAFVFDGVNIIVVGQYIFEGNVKLTNNSVIKSTTESNCFFYYCTTTIEPGSTLEGVIEDYRGGDVIVDGGRTDGGYNETPSVQDSIMHIRWSGDSLTLKNGAYVKVNAVNEIGRVNLASGTSLNVYDSKFDAWEYIDNAGTINVDTESLITTKKITGAGVIVIDAKDITEKTLVIKANLSGFTGSVTIKNNDNVTYEITNEGLIIIPCVASVDGVGYATLQEAIDNANGKTVVLLSDIVVTESIVIAKEANVTIDLAGFDITYVIDQTVSANAFLVINNGTLTLFDDEEKPGEICLTYNGEKVSKTVSTICNYGTLNVDGAWINCVNGANSISYAIDNISNDNAIINISGGAVYGGASGYCIRMFANNIVKENVLNVTGGTVWYVWAQNTNADANNIEINITGGTVSYVYVSAVNADLNCENVKLNISADCVEYEPYVASPVDGYVLQNIDGVYQIIKPVAQIGDVYYATLQDAIDNADGDTVTLICDVELTKTLTIAKGKTVTLDLNGKVLSGTCNSSQAHLIMVENTATLTIKDGGVDGKITYAQGSSNVGWTIDLEGALILESGTIELTGSSWSIGYAVDVRPNAWGTVYDNPTVFTMNGGSIVSSDGAVRVASSSADTYSNITATFIMNDGMIDAGWDGIFIQQSNATYDVLTFTMNGGSIESAFAPIRVYGSAPTDYVNGQDCMNITLNGGSISYTGDDKTWVIDGVICVGGGMTVDMIVDNGNVVVSETVVENLSTPDGYAWVETTDGVYELVEVNYVAEVNGVKYATLQAAIDNADGKTVVLLSDLTIESALADSAKGLFNVADGKNVTIDLNGKTIDVTDNSTGNFVVLYNYGTLTVKNGTMKLTATNNRYWNAQSTIILNRGGNLTIEDGEYIHNGGTDMAITICNSGNHYGDAYLTVNGGEISSTYIAIRNRMEQNSHGASGTAYITVNDGTITGTSRAIWAQASSTSTTSPATGEIKVVGGSVGFIDTARSAGAISMTTVTGGTVEKVKCEVGELTVTGGTVNEFEILTVDNETADYAITEDGVYVQAVAQIDDVYYATLQDAIDNADGDTVTLICDVELTKTLTIAKGKTVTLDLNGYVVSGTCNSGSASLVSIANTATLTIVDSSEGETGKITYAQGSSNVGWTIYVEGDLVLESGTIELTGSWSIGYAVDVRPNAWGAKYTEGTTFTMNGGNIVSSDGAVRVASTSYEGYTAVSASFVMNGGEIDAAWDGIFVQQSDAIWDKLSVTIDGGVIESDKYAIRFYAPAPTSYVANEDCVDIALISGRINSTNDEVEWLVEGLFSIGGGITAEQMLKDVEITASQTFAETNAAEGYEWNAEGKLVQKVEVADKFIKTNLYLNEQISMNFYATLSSVTLADESAYMLATWNGCSKTILVKDAKVEVQNGVTYYVFSVELLAHQMAEEVTITLYVNGEEVISGSRSVKSYAEYIIANANGAYAQKDIDLMISVLNYGAASQVLGGYSDNLANAGLTEAQKALVTNADEAAIKALAPVTFDGAIDGATITNYSLILEGKVGIRVYINLADGEDIANYTAKVNGVITEISYDGSRYYIDRLDIYANELSAIETFELIKGDQTITVKCTALNYSRSVLMYAGSTDAMKNLAKALYLYSVQADAYN